MKEALLIIDMQNDVVEKMVTSGREVIPKIKRVLELFRKFKKPVIHIARVHRPDGVDVEKFRKKIFSEKPFLVKGTNGAEIVDELSPAKNEYIIEKQRFSGFFQTELQILLNNLGVDTLVVTGIQTPNCVRATVIDAIGYDYDVIVLKDATNAKTKEIHEANLLDMENMGVKIMTVDELMINFKLR